MGSTTQLQPQQTSRTRLRAVPTVHDFQKGAVTRSSRRGRLRPALLEWPPLSRDASTSRDSHLNPAACPPESSDRAVDLRLVVPEDRLPGDVVWGNGLRSRSSSNSLSSSLEGFGTVN